jgi:hypothetical protein
MKGGDIMLKLRKSIAMSATIALISIASVSTVFAANDTYNYFESQKLLANEDFETYPTNVGCCGGNYSRY